MLDPIPFASPDVIVKYAQRIADSCSLQSLPLHAHEVLVSLVFYQLTQSYISPRLSTYLFPSIYPNLNKRTKLNWDVHVVSLVQSTLISILALWVMQIDQERKNLDWAGRVFGYTGAGGMIQGFAAGYFLWDLIISARYVNIFGWGLLAHAVSALAVFSLGFRPFLNFYGPTFILYELSSPFLNFHWFFDKLNMTGSRPQWYNGMALLGVFFGCRLVWGTWQSAKVYHDVWNALRNPGIDILQSTFEWSKAHNLNLVDDQTFDKLIAARTEVVQFAEDAFVPIWLAIVYLGSNLTLNALNYFWFTKMIDTVLKRFRTPQPTRKVSMNIVSRVPPELVDAASSSSDDLANVKVSRDDKGAIVIEKKVVRRRKA
ncbi:MAG: hypothetical protein M1834_007133 [Cirrosporium novae-zelandiae]|nr:MAG: hypothetical protein M1834_007133 [Cirrosporium novae-zelandiae]